MAWWVVLPACDQPPGVPPCRGEFVCGGHSHSAGLVPPWDNIECIIWITGDGACTEYSGTRDPPRTPEQRRAALCVSRIGTEAWQASLAPSLHGYKRQTELGPQLQRETARQKVPDLTWVMSSSWSWRGRAGPVTMTGSHSYVAKPAAPWGLESRPEEGLSDPSHHLFPGW